MTTTLPERPLGLRVRDVREFRGLDYRAAAAEIGIATGTLHRLENDGTLDPWLSTARKVEAWLQEHGPAPLSADRLPCGHTVEEHVSHPEFWPEAARDTLGDLIAPHGDYHVNDDGWTVCLCGHVAEGDDDDGSHARHLADVLLAAGVRHGE